MSLLSMLPTIELLLMVLMVFVGEASSLLPQESNAAPSSALPTSHCELDTTQTVHNILEIIKTWHLKKTPNDRPFVTLTFAQSLDGKIALKKDGIGETTTSSNLPLSGKKSLLLTHGLRSVHDAILVGGNTLSTDNPRLSNRLWGENQPRPVVLDTHLEHVCKLGSSRKAQKVIVCCCPEAAESYQENDYLSSLELLPCQCDVNGRLILRDVLERLRDKYRIQNIMVEGGASVHTAFLSERLVDCVCITITPKILGNERGLACFSSIRNTSNTAQQQDDYIDLASTGQESRFVPLGNDCIYLCQWTS